MTYRYSNISKTKLESVHPDLQRLFYEVIKHIDCTVVFGHRTEEQQEEQFRLGHTPLHFPKSNHNKIPALAVDVVPYPIDWANLRLTELKDIMLIEDVSRMMKFINDYMLARARFYHFAGMVRGIAAQLNIGIRWGGDWDNDNDLADQTWMDLPHYELT